MLTALRRKFRLGMQRTVLIAVLLAVGLFSYAFLNLSFCFKLMSHRSLTHMVSTSAAESQHTHTHTHKTMHLYCSVRSTNTTSSVDLSARNCAAASPTLITSSAHSTI